MSILADLVPRFFDNLVRASGQAAVLVGVVLLLQRLLRRWLTPRWRHALWLIVVARLLLPVTPASSWSLFNLAPARPAPRTAAVLPASAPIPADAAAHGWQPAVRPESGPQGLDDPGPTSATPSRPDAAALATPTRLQDSMPALLPGTGVSDEGGLRLTTPAPVPPAGAFRWSWLAAGVWALGVVALAARVLGTTLRFRRGLRASRLITHADSLELLADCRERLRIRRHVVMLEADWVQGPALCGVWRPRLLLPAGLAEHLSREELRHVLLHELAHLKRWDILVNWLASAAQVLHWFNPVVWLALRRLRADRELAADQLALEALGEDHAQSYGGTILKLIEGFTRPVAVPAVVGILEDQGAMRERIAAIAAFRRPSRASELAAVLVAGLAVVSLTDAAPGPAETAPSGSPASTSAGSPPPAGDSRFRPLDLAPHYVTRWETIKPGTSWASVPKGRQTFDEVPFDLGGILELSGLGALRDNKQFPTRVEGIAAGGPLATLHLLHAAAYDAPDGTPIVKLVLHYADGGTADLPLRYGVHSRNWWVESSEKSAAISDPATRVVWTGTSPQTDPWGVTLRLFHTRLANPRPDQPVVHVDVVSLLARATPVILALTAEGPSGDETVAAAAPAVPTASEVAAIGRSRLRTVAADSGEPIVGARVRLQVADAQGTHAFGEHRANREGRVTLDFPPQGITQFTLVARAPGYLTRQEVISSNRLPAELTMRLEAGVRIGGVVRDGRGGPVSGAQVQVNGVMRDAAGQFIKFEFDKVVTDATGGWSSRSVPPNPTGLNLKLTHPDFFPVEYNQADEPAEGVVPTTRLLAGEVVMIMEPGIAVTGTVVDAAGNAVAEAEAVLATGDELATRRTARADAEGRFRIVALETGLAIVLAQAPGRAPEQREIELAPGFEPILIALGPGRSLRGRVMDERNQPVAGAVVTVERWQDPTLLTWRAETDAEGRFTWDAAPTGEVRLAVSKAGYSRTLRKVNPSQDSEITLRLAKTLQFAGRVLDAETGQAIPSFRLVRGYHWGGVAEDDTQWEPGREWSIANAEGTFQVGLDSQPGGRVRYMAYAEGYLPEVTPVFEASGWHEHEFKLKKGEGPRGVVVNAAGQPIAGAEVAMVGFGYLSLGKGAFRDRGSGQTHLTRTDDNGRFALPALLPNPGLIAVHPEHGFAELSAGEWTALGKITLRPWGRIEGVMKHGSKVAPNEEVCLVNESYRPIAWHLEFEVFKTRTDAAGRFTFEQAPPGARQLMRPVPFSGRGWSWSHLQRLTVKPGEVTQVTYGGTGRPVIGKVVLGDASPKIEWSNGHHSLSTRFPAPPDGLDYGTWQMSPEFKAAMARQRHYSPTWQTDGAFRIEDVEAGRYQLNLQFMEPSEGFPQTSIGSINREVEMPEIPGGQSDEPLDLGELKLALRSEQDLAAERQRQAEAGARRAGEAEQVPTLGGGTFGVSQLGDQHVLMTAWSATNEASRAELLLLRGLHAEYAKDARLLMLGAVMDEDPAPARKLVAELEIPWEQLLPSEQMKLGMLGELGDAPLPVSFLLRARNTSRPVPLRGEAVLEAVRKALGDPAKSAAGSMRTQSEQTDTEKDTP